MIGEYDPALQTLVHDVLERVVDRAVRRPHPSLPRRLAGLFRTLAAAGSPHAAEQAQDLIWAVWCDHPNTDAATRMHEGIALMASEQFDEALAVFDALVIAEPDWAEAWNKRATVLFIAQRDAESLADIARVLELEPRHFGAMSGFGQIALRNGYPHEAVVAFQAVLSINPHLRGVEAVLEELERDRAASLN